MTHPWAVVWPPVLSEGALCGDGRGPPDSGAPRRLPGLYRGTGPQAGGPLNPSRIRAGNLMKAGRGSLPLLVAMVYGHPGICLPLPRCCPELAAALCSPPQPSTPRSLEILTLPLATC